MQPRNAIRARLVRLAVGLGLLAALAACGKKVGDGCTTNVDCSPNGDRLCDRSQPGGYCTVDGCDETSCPGEATCVRFFETAFLTRPCDPVAEATPDVPHECAPDELCLPEGLCAPRDGERRYCEATCSHDSDCRGDYECRSSGVRGAIVLTRKDNPSQFCAPR